MSMKNFNYTIGNRTRDLPACSAVPQPTAPQRAWEGVPVPIQYRAGWISEAVWTFLEKI